MNVTHVFHNVVPFIRFCILKQRIPLYVTMRVTDKCNFQCSYCHIANKSIEADAPSQVIIKAIKEFAVAGTLRINFSGGEPLLRDDIGELISCAHQYGLITSLSSNGWFAAEKAKDLCDLDMLFLSLDGNKKIHDEQRRTGSFERIIEAIDVFKKTNTEVYGFTVLTQNNTYKNEIDYLIRLAGKKDIKMFFQPVEVDDPFNDCLAPTPKAMSEIVFHLQKLKQEGAPIANTSAYLQFLEQWPFKSAHTKCWAGRISCIVNADGTVAPCNNCLLANDSGNAFQEDSLKAFQKIGKFQCYKCWTNRQHSLDGSH